MGITEIYKILTFGDTENDILKIVGSLAQLSTHILDRSLVKLSQSKKIILSYPDDYQEFFGQGISGVLHEKYYFGKLSFLEKQGVFISHSLKAEQEEYKKQGLIAVYLGDRQKVRGIIFFRDVIRPESENVFTVLRDNGIKKIMMLTGDHAIVAAHISEQLGFGDVLAECLPEQKMQQIKKLQSQNFSPVVMVGDGVNDAAALASADVGIAMGFHGSSAASETADIVITVDNLFRVAEGYTIARRMMHIALEGIWIGIGLSLLLMVFAMLGYIQPVSGALIQEIVDVLVIGNALRVLL